MISKKYWLLFSFSIALITPFLILGRTQQVFKSAATAQTPPTTANLPKQPFLPTPGWLGLATVASGGKLQYRWSPSHPNGQAVIVSDTEAWAKVKAGTPLVAVAPNFKQKVTFLRSSEERYGCDGVPTGMAAFSAPKRPPEGPVWLLPERDAQTATAISVQKLPLAQVPANLLPRPLPKNSEVRAWKAGSIIILQRKESAHKVKMTVANNSQIIFTQTQEKYFFNNGEPRPPLNLATAKGEPGISEPVGVVQLKPSVTPTIVFWVPGYEGNGFTILASDGKKVKEYEGASLYFCGY
ncbi:MAG: hypothetical protein U7127_15580 [Phormidium sp.]